MATTLYATTEELAAYLGIDDTVDNTRLAMALEAACRWVDSHTGRRFYLDDAASTRTFEVTASDEIYIDDLADLTDVDVRTDDGTGTFPTLLTVADYELRQDQLAGPYVRLRSINGGLPVTYPYGRAARVQITGIWGWPAVPADVKYATLIQAAHLFHRKDSPQGVAGFGEFGGIRVSQGDKDAIDLLSKYVIDFGIA